MRTVLSVLLCLPFTYSFSFTLSHAPETSRSALLGGLKTSKLSQCSIQLSRRRFSLSMSTLPPGWQELKVPNSARKYYYNPTTGVTQWDLPESDTGAKKPQKIELMVPEDVRNRRAEQYEKVMAIERLQDAEKAKRGTLANKSNQSAFALGLLFIGGPLLTLAVLFLTGVVPNPFEVCIEGGTSC
jgi:hypothetical protein